MTTLVLPNEPDDCLKKVIKLLKDYKWIFTSSNTQFITSGALEQIPIEWIDCFLSITNEEFNQIPFNYKNESWPSTLKIFLSELKLLKPTIISNEINTFNRQLGISPKKCHEIEQLSCQIYDICKTNVDIVIDMGCGLGYLSQILNEKYKYNVLGIEADPERIKTAELRQRKYFNNSISSVKFVQHFIGLTSAIFIKNEIDKHFTIDSSMKMAIVGLHACADLTLTAIDLFLQIQNISNIIIMPCCYHKMNMIDDEQNFENIPKSETLKNITDFREILCRPFLRLASQQSAVKWKKMSETEHRDHGLNMFERSALENVLKKDEMVLKTIKNASIKPPVDIFAKYSLYDKNSRKMIQWTEQHKNNLNNLIMKYKNGGQLAEILTCLQSCVQFLCEYVVLIDKVYYIEEFSKRFNQQINVFLRKLMDEDISPRCIALIAIKL